MPLFAFHCGEGHITERLCPREMAVIPCPACGSPATRQAVNQIGVTGFARQPVSERMVRMGAFNEASSELAYQATRETNVDGSERASPPLWQMAKSEAKRLEKLGVKDALDVRTG